MSTHYIKLKNDANIENYIQKEKIQDFELETPEERFPFNDLERSSIEVYHKGSYEECTLKIQSLDEDIKDLFEIIED